jgi:hypothetical protein
MNVSKHRRPAAALALLCLALSVPAPLLARQPNVLLAGSSAVAPQVPAPVARAGTCVAPAAGSAAGAGLNTTLPLPLLDYLERISASGFAHAFLLHHVATTGAPDHWMTRCANSFIDTRIEDLPSLRQNQLGARTVIRALRAAEESRLREEEIRAAANVTLSSLIRDLLQDPGEAGVRAHLPYLRHVEERRCAGRRESVCEELQEAIAHGDTALARAAAVDAVRGDVDALQESLSGLERRLLEARSAVEYDSVRLRELWTAAETPADSADAREYEGELTRRMTARTTAGWAVNDAAASRDSAFLVLRRMEASAADALQRLVVRLRLLDAQLARAAEAGTQAIDLPPRQQPAARALFSDPLPLTMTPATQRVSSSNLIVELADFVITRTKQELALAYLTGVYSWMREDAQLQRGFPQTFQLMHGLTDARSGRGMSVTSAGQIPLGIWRATLAHDFLRLPLNLFESAPTVLCKADLACQTRVGQLWFVAAAGNRLMEGDAVLEVLRDAPLLASRTRADASPEWALAMHGLGMVAGIAEAYHVQAADRSVDPARFPYLLSADALSQVPRGQHDAFIRLLLLRAVPENVTVGFAIDERLLLNSLGRAMRSVETIAHAGPDAGGPVQAMSLVRSALAALTTGLDVSGSLATAPTGARLLQMKSDWENLSRAIEATAGGNHGLALSRTLALLGGVTGTPASRNMLSIAGLAAGLAEARSGDEVRLAFEAAASPVGGWQAKRFREGSRSSINAYPGLSFGAEWLLPEATPGATVGVALPVGFEVQLLRRASGAVGTPDCTLGVCSLALFMPVVDLGSFLSYRISDHDDVESNPNTSLRQLFAPGAYLSLGIGRSPANLLLGGQLMPGQRKVTDPESRLSGNAVRFGLAIVLDVILMDF